MEIIEKNYFFKNKDFLEHISQKLKLDDDELYLYLKIAFFILNEKKINIILIISLMKQFTLF